MGDAVPASFREAVRATLDPTVRLREEDDADLVFLRTLYASTRAEELAPVPWPDEAKRAFLDHQFELQRAQYREHYLDAEWLVIERGAAPIGRLYLKRGNAEVRMMDIALLPQVRAQGLGTHLTRALIDWAAAQGLPVTLHVEPFNPAYRMYQRFGFEYRRSTGIYHFLERPLPASPAGAIS